MSTDPADKVRKALSDYATLARIYGRREATDGMLLDGLYDLQLALANEREVGRREGARAALDWADNNIIGALTKAEKAEAVEAAVRTLATPEAKP